MARRSVQSLPAVPTEGVPQAHLVFFTALKEVVEKLIGLRGDTGLAAITKNSISLNVSKPTITRPNAAPAAFNIGGVNVASGEAFGVLITDVEQLMQDVARLNTEVDTLTKQLKGDS